MRHVLIVNPVSGKEDARAHIIPKLQETARKKKIELEIIITQHPGHASEIARELGKTGDELRLYACGGDGTLNEVFCGAHTYTNVEVACVPCGSGNDFVRTYGNPAAFLNFDELLDGTAICIDLMAANDRVSAAICSVGMDSDIAYMIPQFRRLPLCGGTAAYMMAIIKRMCQQMGRRLRVEIDGAVVEDNFIINTICNGKAYGGGYMANPIANLQDGVLEVILVKKVSRLHALMLLAKYKTGAHISEGEVIPSFREVMTLYRAKKIKITPTDGCEVIVNIDGEAGYAPFLDVEVMSGAARFVLPSSLYSAFVKQHSLSAVTV